MGETSIRLENQVANRPRDRVKSNFTLTVAAQHYLKLSAEEVQQAYAKHIRPDAFVTAVKGPEPH